MTPEKKLEKQVKDYLQSLLPKYPLYYCVNLTGAVMRQTDQGKIETTNPLIGYADMSIIINGRIIFLELKAGYNKQTDAQKIFELKVKRAGAQYYVVYAIDEVKTIVENELRRN